MDTFTDTVPLVQITEPTLQSACDKDHSLDTWHEPVGVSASENSRVEHYASEVSIKILEVVFDHALNKFEDTMQRLEAGRPKFLSVIERFVAIGARVEMCLPAFPFKSANKVYKVLGILPDKADEIALERLNNMCVRIEDIYTPGASCTIISDGLVYNDLLSISDKDTWAYGQAIREMAVAKGFSNISFSRIRDLVDVSMPEKMEEITYVANATNFRRSIFNRFGRDDIDIGYEIATNPDTQMTYLGYRRFLESDLEYIFPLGSGRSKHSYKRDVRYLAKQMLIRGYAFAGAVRHSFPNHLRLSIHQSTGEHKISMSLLNTKTGFTTPWHCSVALMMDGEWVSAPMGEFRKNPRMKIVWENNRPSYFQETETTIDVRSNKKLTNQPVVRPKEETNNWIHSQIKTNSAPSPTPRVSYALQAQIKYRASLLEAINEFDRNYDLLHESKNHGRAIKTSSQFTNGPSPDQVWQGVFPQSQRGKAPFVLRVAHHHVQIFGQVFKRLRYRNLHSRIPFQHDYSAGSWVHDSAS